MWNNLSSTQQQQGDTNFALRSQGAPGEGGGDILVERSSFPGAMTPSRGLPIELRSRGSVDSDAMALVTHGSELYDVTMMASVLDIAWKISALTDK
ncbi:hypothetical protein MKZ38_009820 [Zalerion maritima]|uniref:Uncharacterized protein n=1 Tax=Zalerion maritima TaxID=339359 RepID=A0AAD5RYA3_9PEZI|nr:hypothetical protein MKZ38_009820 [Zalerion maritima]